MSSASDSDSETSEFPNRVLSSPQISQNGQDQVVTARQPANMDPYLLSHESTWSHREPSGHGAGASSSTSPLRTVSSPQFDPNRYGATPFSMASMPVEARRQNIMAMDRKRRLTSSNQDNSGRRRNLAGGFNDRDDPQHIHTGDALPSSSRSPGRPQRRRSSPRSTTEVIDLTSSPLQPQNSDANPAPRSSASTSGIYVVPRWQPDSEANECPICKRQFTFYFRRHHCRKCGRVVCDACSPHRITIPRQFIVQPPGTVDLTGDDEDSDEQPHTYSGLLRQYRSEQTYGIGGGEKVRLCNPCVPDPQPEPQPNYASSTLPSAHGISRRDDLLSLSDALRGSRHDYHHHHNNNNTMEQFPRFVSRHHLPYDSQTTRVRPLPLPPQPRNDVGMDASQINSFPYSSSDRYRQRGHMSFDNSQAAHHRHLSAGNPHMPLPPADRSRVRTILEDSYLPRMFSGHVPPARPRLNEEDICPVCRRALPSKGPDGDETAREAHIIDCISARDPANQASGHRRSSTGQLAARGPVHMLPFVATEKDCVSEDGNTPECSICMVEYDVGDELARLECLCKFHRECISEWFTRKQECPVHKIS